MSLTLTKKYSRVLFFLVGCANPRIFALLGTRGFTQDDLARGWDIFQTAAGAKLKRTNTDASLLSSPASRDALAKLDQWENAWFPVIKATLLHNFLSLHQEVFLNLAQTDGPEVLVSVGTMLERLNTMVKTPEGQKAMALLNKRMLTEDELDVARKLIATIKTAQDVPELGVEDASREQQQQAAAAMWAWYREWSQIARAVITRGDMLIRLGLRSASGKDLPDDEEPRDMGGPTD